DRLGPDVICGDLFPGVRVDGRWLEHPPASEWLMIGHVEDEALGDGEVGDDAVVDAIFGRVAHAEVEPFTDGPSPQGCAVELHVALSRFQQAQHELGEFALSVALNTRDSDDLAATDLK